MQPPEPQRVQRERRTKPAPVTSPPSITRAWAGVGILILLAFVQTRPVAAWQTTSANVPMLNRFPRMMQEYLVQRVRRLDTMRQHRLQSIDSREAAIEYRDEVRRKIRQCFGSEPPRTPLNARTTRSLERNGYTIENVIFESRPGFPVTANLYLPSDRSRPRPAVVGTCGHSDNGKALPAYQAFAQGLVRRGYVVLLYDPIGQGERLQYVDAHGQPQHGIGVREHLHAGNQQLLVGQFFGAWRAWDGIRALDYLATRPEVNPQHIGITGNSGGGTMTTWLWGLDERWAMAAPSCFVTSFLRNAENELPADIEQSPPHAL